MVFALILALSIAALLHFLRFYVLSKHRDPSRMASLVIAVFLVNIAVIANASIKAWLPYVILFFALISAVPIWSNLKQTKAPKLLEYALMLWDVVLIGFAIALIFMA